MGHWFTGLQFAEPRFSLTTTIEEEIGHPPVLLWVFRGGTCLNVGIHSWNLSMWYVVPKYTILCKKIKKISNRSTWHMGAQLRFRGHDWGRSRGQRSNLTTPACSSPKIRGSYLYWKLAKTILNLCYGQKSELNMGYTIYILYGYFRLSDKSAFYAFFDRKGQKEAEIGLN